MGTTMLSTTNVFCVKMTASKTSSLKESSRRYRRRRRRNDDGFATTTTRAKADGSKESNIFDKIANEANKMLDVMMIDRVSRVPHVQIVDTRLVFWVADIF